MCKTIIHYAQCPRSHGKEIDDEILRNCKCKNIVGWRSLNGRCPSNCDYGPRDETQGSVRKAYTTPLMVPRNYYEQATMKKTSAPFFSRRYETSATKQNGKTGGLEAVEKGLGRSSWHTYESSAVERNKYREQETAGRESGRYFGQKFDTTGAKQDKKDGGQEAVETDNVRFLGQRYEMSAAKQNRIDRGHVRANSALPKVQRHNVRYEASLPPRPRRFSGRWPVDGDEAYRRERLEWQKSWLGRSSPKRRRFPIDGDEEYIMERIEWAESWY